jgi:hypothetical protein
MNDFIKQFDGTSIQTTMIRQAEMALEELILDDAGEPLTDFSRNIVRGRLLEGVPNESKLGNQDTVKCNWLPGGYTSVACTPAERNELLAKRRHERSLPRGVLIRYDCREVPRTAANGGIVHYTQEDIDFIVQSLTWEQIGQIKYKQIREEYFRELVRQGYEVNRRPTRTPIEQPKDWQPITKILPPETE